MTAHYLKFADEPEAIDCLQCYRRDGQWIKDTRDYSLCVVGIITYGGVLDVDGNELEPPLKRYGFHINLLGDLPLAAAPFEVFPATPSTVFAV